MAMRLVCDRCNKAQDADGNVHIINVDLSEKDGEAVELIEDMEICETCLDKVKSAIKYNIRGEKRARKKRTDNTSDGTKVKTEKKKAVRKRKVAVDN